MATEKLQSTPSQEQPGIKVVPFNLDKAVPHGTRDFGRTPDGEGDSRPHVDHHDRAIQGTATEPTVRRGTAEPFALNTITVMRGPDARIISGPSETNPALDGPEIGNARVETTLPRTRLSTSISEAPTRPTAQRRGPTVSAPVRARR